MTGVVNPAEMTAMLNELLQGYADVTRLLEDIIALTTRLVAESSDELEQILRQRQMLLDALTACEPVRLFHRTADCYAALMSLGRTHEAHALQQAQERVRQQFSQVQESEDSARVALEDARDALLALLKTHAQRQAMKRYVLGPGQSAPRFLESMR